MGEKERERQLRGEGGNSYDRKSKIIKKQNLFHGIRRVKILKF
jgi:hypothetical protein